MIDEKEKSIEKIGLTAARNELGNLVKQVAYTKKAVIIQEHSKDKVALIPSEQLANTIVLNDEERDRFLAALRNPPEPTDELKEAMADYLKENP